MQPIVNLKRHAANQQKEKIKRETEIQYRSSNSWQTLSLKSLYKEKENEIPIDRRGRIEKRR